ncbi:MAG TPA: hypothetical protein VMS76_01385 [Planctomycetota bacterium]|nr:hypothetical protein [Planctomycetota bacterium]
MSKDEMRTLLAEQMARFRAWSYAQLAAKIEPDWRKRSHFEFVEGVAPDGTKYIMEFDVLWDDKPQGDIRLLGSLYAFPQRPLWGFLPIYRPDVGDDFIMAPDGRFVGEDDAESGTARALQ